MLGSFLITLREGLEAGLIVAIVLAYLRQIGRRDGFPAAWAGLGAAVLVSLLLGWLAYNLLGGLRGAARQLVFATIYFFAVGVLTWMVFWMRRQARAIRGELQQQVDRALAAGSVLGLAGVVFFAAVREGLETVLFLLAIAAGEQPASFAAGAVLGILGAALLTYLIYMGGRRVNIVLFFQVTGVLILILAAGLLAKGVMSLQLAGAMPTFRIGPLGYPLWDLRHIEWLNPARSTLAQFLSGFLGWDATPSWEEVAAYVAYLCLGLRAYFAGGQPPRRAPVAVARSHEA